jgi:5-hydroxyisourate hydrolase
MNRLTTHILDTSIGKPAAGVTVVLLLQQGEGWTEVTRGSTNQDGRITDWLDKSTMLPTGVFKLVFETGAYFNKAAIPTFYPFVEVVVAIADEAHYHIPLLLSPYGYSTYRGS